MDELMRSSRRADQVEVSQSSPCSGRVLQGGENEHGLEFKDLGQIKVKEKGCQIE